MVRPMKTDQIRDEATKLERDAFEFLDRQGFYDAKPVKAEREPRVKERRERRQSQPAWTEIDARIAAALAAHTEGSEEAIGTVIAQIRQQLRAEFGERLAELRGEIIGRLDVLMESRRMDKDVRAVPSDAITKADRRVLSS
jgi:hypothetical protein